VTALLEYLGLGTQIIFGQGLKAPSQLLRINIYLLDIPTEKEITITQIHNEITI